VSSEALHLLISSPERQSQQKAKADQPLQQTLETPIPATDNPSDIFKFSTGTWPTHPSPIKSPGGSIGFGVNCLHGGANGLIGIQNFMNMDDLKGSPLSTLLAGPLPGIFDTDSAEHTLSSSDRDSNSKHSSHLASRGESSTHRTTPDSFDTSSLPKVLTDKSTPASAGSASTLFPRTTQCDDVDSGCLSALHIAAQKGHHGIMRVLLQQDIDCDEVDSDGLTSLIHATIGGHEDVVTLLLMHGARIDKVDRQGRSVLHFAVTYRREVILTILLDYCVGDQEFIDAYDSGGRTPLHIAVDTGFEEGVQVLLQRGASVHCKTRKTVVP
jgi:FOG: Ankyrin repeat